MSTKIVKAYSHFSYNNRLTAYARTTFSYIYSMTLLSTERHLLTFDRISKQRIEENRVTIEVDDIRKFVTARSDDPQFIDGYVLDALQIEKLNEFAEKKVIPDFSKCYYMLVCVGIYDWMDCKE